MSVKLLLYCTKAKQKIRVTEHLYMYEDDLYKLPNGKIKFGNSFELSLYDGQYSKDNFLNGKIVAECKCQKVEKWFWNGWWNCYAKNNDIDVQNIDDEDFEKSCLNFGYLYDYLFENDGYALYLSNVKVFDEPYDINECYQYKKWQTRLTKAPQNMCRVYGKKRSTLHLNLNSTTTLM